MLPPVPMTLSASAGASTGVVQEISRGSPPVAVFGRLVGLTSVHRQLVSGAVVDELDAGRRRNICQGGGQEGV